MWQSLLNAGPLQPSQLPCTLLWIEFIQICLCFLAVILMLVCLLLHSQANDRLLSFIDRNFYVSVSVHPRVHLLVLPGVEDI